MSVSVLNVLLAIVGILSEGLSPSSSTTTFVRRVSSTVDLSGSESGEVNSTIPAPQRRTDEFYDSLETANNQYNPSPSPQTLNSATGNPSSNAHQDQINYLSNLLRTYNPDGFFQEPYGTFYPQQQNQGPQSSGSAQTGSTQSTASQQPFETFGQNFPPYNQFQGYPHHPNFRPQAGPNFSPDSSGDPSPTRATYNNPVTNDIGFSNFPPPPPTPSFPPFSYPNYTPYNVNNSQVANVFPSQGPHFGNFGGYGQQPLNPFAIGNPQDENQSSSQGAQGFPQPDYRYPFNYGPNYQGYQGVPQQQAGPEFGRGHSPPQPSGAGSSATPQPTEASRTQEQGVANPTASSAQNDPAVHNNPNNPGQFEGYHPRFPYGPPATLPANIQQLRPGSEYGYGYNPSPVYHHDGRLPPRDSNASSSQAQPFQGYVGYPLYANLGPQSDNPAQVGYFNQGPPIPQQDPRLQYQSPPGNANTRQENVQSSAIGPHSFPPPRPAGPPQSGLLVQNRPRLVDNYGDQQPPGTQGSSSFRDLRRRPLAPNYFHQDALYYQGSFSNQPSESEEEAAEPAPTALLGKLKRRGQIVATGSTPKCAKTTNSTFCLEDRDYPRDKVKRAIYSSPSSLDLLYKDTSASGSSVSPVSTDVFGARILPSEDIRTPGPNRGLALDAEKKRATDLNAPCPSSVHYARPLRALSAKGEWKVVVNMQDEKFENEVAEQIVRLDICSQQSMPCSFSGAATSSSPSRCLQKRKLHRLLAWSQKEGLHQEAFYLPVACSCFVSN